MVENNQGCNLAFIGTYAHPQSEGIYVFRMDENSGEWNRLAAVSGIANPSFLEVDPVRRILYAVSEMSAEEAVVTSFSFVPETGGLSKLNSQPVFSGSPCHLSLDRSRELLFVSNYKGGTVSCFNIENDGKIGKQESVVHHRGSSVHPIRQQVPHPHSVIIDPSNRFVMVPDLGTDQVIVYQIEQDTRTLTYHSKAHVSPGAGPRHMVFHPNARFAYVINELDSTIALFSYRMEEGTLELLQTISTLPDGFVDANYCADIHISPCGRFLYGSNRGHDSIVVFNIDSNSGCLSGVEHTPTWGKIPRNFAITPNGRFLAAANQDSDCIVTFSIESDTGKLSRIEDPVPISKPVCIKFA
jgi:6-phosphogluconolactonase